MKSFMRLLLKLAVAIAAFIATVVTVVTLIAFSAGRWWMGELLCQLRPQYALALSLCFPFLVWRFRPAGWLTLIPLLVNVSAFVPLYIQPRQAPVPGLHEFSVLHYNLDNTLASHDAAFAYLRNHPADILSLQEFTPADVVRLSQELPGYTIVYSNPMTNSHGSALLISSESGIQVRSADIIHLPDDSVRPMIEAMFDIDGHSVAFLSVHAIRPVSAWNADFQRTEFMAVAEWSRRHQEQGQMVLMLGDINSTSWSANFRELQQSGHLLNSERGFGLEPTWPVTLPSLFMIPIDHCLHESGIIITERFAGPFLGSDHAPLHVHFVLSDV